MKEKPVLFVKSISQESSVSGESSLPAKLLEAQDNERRKISRELHDSVGQSLTAAKIGLAKLKAKLPATELASLNDIEQMVDGALTEVRTVSFLLHPPTLDLMGLRSSIVWYAEGFEQRTGIRTSVEVPELLPQFEAGIETMLFRIVQESLTNVHKHAMASRVIISATVTRNEFQLTIHDNGAGFGDSAREGVGIGGICERLKERNGKLEIKSSKTVGSSIIATIPIANNITAFEPVESGSLSMAPTTRRRILLVDHQDLFRSGVQSLLASEADLEICGEASNAEEALELANKLRPDVIVLDLQLPGHNGWWVFRELRRMQLANNVMILSQYDLPQIQYAAKLAGCSGFVSKTRASERLVTAIRAVLDGGTSFDQPTLESVKLLRATGFLLPLGEMPKR